MVPLALFLLLQAPARPPEPVELPVSVDRIREGLARPPSPFDLPPPRAWRAVFRVKVEAWVPFEAPAWADDSPVPLFVRPSAPPLQFEFLQSVTPEEVRASTVHPCCNVMPAVSAVGSAIRNGIRSVKEKRAKREVEEAMRAAGIRKR